MICSNSRYSLSIKSFHLYSNKCQLFCTLIRYARYQGYLFKRKLDLANQVGYSLMGGVAYKPYKAVNNYTRNGILHVFY